MARLAPGRRFLVRAGLVLLLGLLVASLTALLPPVHRAVDGTPFFDLVQDLIYLAAALLVGARALLLRGDRLTWALLGAGLLIYAIGNVVYLLVVAGQDPEPFPSVADPLWLAFYPLAYAGAVLMLRRSVTRWHTSMWLDGMVVALGVASVTVAIFLQPALELATGSRSAVLVNLAYPVVDLLLLTLVGGAFAVLRWQPGPTWWLLGAGMTAFCVADALYVVQVAQETHVTGAWLDDVWLVGVVAVVLAAWSRRGERAAVELPAWAVLAVPMGFAAVSLGLLVVHGLRAAPGSGLVVVLAAATVVTALLRTSLTFREIQGLADARVQARTDELTGLPNRRRFVELIDLLLGESRTGTGAVLLIDLDRFKEVNDSFGHASGDQLLRLVGPRLQHAIRHGDTVSRLGADEFAVLLPGADAEQATAVAKRVVTQLGAPFNLDGVPLHVGASIGVALFPQHGASASPLLQSADQAMYDAKRAHLGYQLHVPRPDGGSRQRLELLEELRTGLEDHQLVVHYQPKLNLATGRTSGVEALVRWQHPRLGLLYPDTFLPLAELAGLMHSVALLVLEQALHDVSAWRATGARVSVAVNLSVSDLRDPHLPAQVAALMAKAGLLPEALLLEITENVLMVDPERAQQVLAALRELGIRLSVDDYGSGYSSLAYLRALPVQEVKLDRSFVTHLSTDPRCAVIVRSTIELSHQLGMQMVAEGVEDAAALLLLSQWGCDLAQGYHIARPGPAGLIAARLVAERQADAVAAAG